MLGACLDEGYERVARSQMAVGEVAPGAAARYFPLVGKVGIGCLDHQGRQLGEALARLLIAPPLNRRHVQLAEQRGARLAPVVPRIGGQIGIIIERHAAREHDGTATLHVVHQLGEIVGGEILACGGQQHGYVLHPERSQPVERHGCGAPCHGSQVVLHLFVAHGHISRASVGQIAHTYLVGLQAHPAYGGRQEVEIEAVRRLLLGACVHAALGEPHGRAPAIAVHQTAYLGVGQHDFFGTEIGMEIHHIHILHGTQLAQLLQEVILHISQTGEQHLVLRIHPVQGLTCHMKCAGITRWHRIRFVHQINLIHHLPVSHLAVVSAGQRLHVFRVVGITPGHLAQPGEDAEQLLVILATGGHDVIENLGLEFGGTAKDGSEIEVGAHPVHSHRTGNLQLAVAQGIIHVGTRDVGAHPIGLLEPGRAGEERGHMLRAVPCNRPGFGLPLWHHRATHASGSKRRQDGEQERKSRYNSHSPSGAGRTLVISLGLHDLEHQFGNANIPRKCGTCKHSSHYFPTERTRRQEQNSGPPTTHPRRAVHRPQAAHTPQGTTAHRRIPGRGDHARRRGTLLLCGARRGGQVDTAAAQPAHLRGTLRQRQPPTRRRPLSLAHPTALHRGVHLQALLPGCSRGAAHGGRHDRVGLGERSRG